MPLYTVTVALLAVAPSFGDTSRVLRRELVTLRTVSRPEFVPVKPRMLGCREDLKVRDPVVLLIAVDVMNLKIAVDEPARIPHDLAVLEYIPV